MIRIIRALVLFLSLALAGCTAAAWKQTAAIVDAVDVGTCSILEAVTAPGTAEEIGHVCAASRPLVQGIVNALGSLFVGAGPTVLLDLRARHPVHRTIAGRRVTIGHLRSDWARRVQGALDTVEPAQ
jgi:hypothetical protein